MSQSTNSKAIAAVITGIVIVSASLVFVLPNLLESPTEIEVTLIYNAGVMIEAKGVRIFIDPLYLPNNYSELSADVILITHPHTDHYNPEDIDEILTNDTLFVCPKNMTGAIEQYDGFGVNPGDSFLVGDINITAFPLYLPDYPSGAPSFHPREANWTSYIIEIDGFTIFHAGDTKYIDEYDQLTGLIDVAFLPIYFDGGLGPLNASLLPIVDAINTIQPRYAILTHYMTANLDIFMTEYSILVDSPSSEILGWAYETSRIFTADGA
ncbi:MAG: MBL fold metallo-hydrolase [Candidatus Thorarchaeota archaeon]